MFQSAAISDASASPRLSKVTGCNMKLSFASNDSSCNRALKFATSTGEEEPRDCKIWDTKVATDIGCSDDGALACGRLC